MLDRSRCARAALAILLLCTCLDGRARTRTGEWRSYGYDPGGSRYSPLDQVRRDNVSRLAQAWVYHHGEPAAAPGREGPAFESTPLMIGDLLYFTSPRGRVIALDAESGAERWTFDPRLTAAQGAPRHRGVAYWEAGRDRRIFVGTHDGRLIALDASTGRPRAAFGDRGQIQLDARLSLRSPPAVFKHLVIVGSAAPEFPASGPSGDVRAFDARTGRQVWEFHTIPRPGEPGHDTWEAGAWRGRTGANVWSMMAVDDVRGLVFLPIGSASYDFYGGDRRGQNLYASSIVALDAATGRLRWHFQTVHHDLWDFDVPAQPVLVSVEHDGRRVDAVAQVSKTGFVYLLERETGRPLFPIEERPVAASTVPGEAAWPTQPFPLKPPALARIAPLTRDDLSDVTPEARQYCEALFDRVVSGGLFTPHGEKLTLVFPGNLGGASWSGAAFDPGSGYLFVNVNELGAVGEMRKLASGGYRRGSDLPRGEYARFWDERRWPCQKPPWGTLNAVNLHDGSIAWRVPLGMVEALAAKGMKDTGTPNLGGAIVTAGGLVFIAGSNDARMRAFDARTGAVLWEAALPASGHATPMTYLGPRSGTQFVAIAAGGGGYLSSTHADALVAFTLK
ncbi:MAG TPA: pyrroloquinoline quinone-dependent dehydrogenase [Vicinamibacterales bacterium]|nr:pyrroloquinoline quinone-dependent dehydrogenase [Vicinamibacterales bacterium]